MKNLFRNKTAIGITSFVLASSLIVGTVAIKRSKKTGEVTVGIPTVYAASNLTDYDSASSVNYSTIMGRAVDYGIVSESIYLPGHMETTFATKMYKTDPSKNCDVDLAGTAPAQFIIADIAPGSNAIFGQTAGAGMQFVFDTTPELVEGGRYVFNSEYNGETLFRLYDKDQLDDAVQSLIDKMKRESGKFAAKDSFDGDEIATFNGVKATIDLSDESFKNSTIYIDINPGSKLETAMQTCDGILVKKHPNTNVVFNVRSTGSVVMHQYKVQIIGGINDIPGYNEGDTFNSTTDCKGNDSPHNQAVDKYMARHIVWNITSASSIKYNMTSGLFLVPNGAPGTVVGSSAGWIVSAGETTIADGEFHYIYHDRVTDANVKDESVLHFAARKSFTDDFEANPIKEMTNVYSEAGDFEYEFVETHSDFDTNNAIKTYLMPGDKPITNDENGKITFPVLHVPVTEIDPVAGTTRYFVIRETVCNSADPKISNPGGEIDIVLHITNLDGIIHYVVDYWKYNTSEDKQNNKVYESEIGVKVSGAEFSLGAYLNKYDLDKGSLTLTKTVNGDDPNKTYSVAVMKGKQYLQPDGSLSTEEYYFTLSKDTPVLVKDVVAGEYTVVEKEGDLPEYKLVSKEVSPDPVIVAANQNTPVTITNTYSKITLPGTATLTLNKQITIDDKAVSPVPSVLKNQTFEVNVKVASGPDNGKYVQDIHGAVASGEKAFTVSVDSPVTLYGLVAGTTYEIIEKGSSNIIGSYKPVSANGSTSNMSYAVKSYVMPDGASTFDLVNDYTLLVGNLTLRKSFVCNGSPIDPADLDLSGLKFAISGPEAFNPIEVSWSAFTNGEYLLENIPIGEYTVTEIGADDTSNAKYVFARAHGNNFATLSNDNRDVSIALTNEYNTVGANKLILNKSLDVYGLGPAERDQLMNQTYGFSIMNAQGKYYSEKEVNGVKTVEFIDTETFIYVKPGWENRYETLDIPAGKYTINEENTANPNGLSKSVVYVNGQLVTVTKDSATTVNINNIYSKFSIDVTKEVTGDNPYANTEYEFCVKNQAGQFIDQSGNPTSQAYYYTIRAGETVEVVLKNPGEYTIIEKGAGQSENSHFTMTTVYAKASDPNSTTDPANCDQGIVVNLEPNRSSDAVTITNDYTYNHYTQLVLQKTDANGNLIGGAQFSFEVKSIAQPSYESKITLTGASSGSSLSSFTTVDDQEITIANLIDGVYEIKELQAPQDYNGYQGSIVVTVENGAITSVLDQDGNALSGQASYSAGTLTVVNQQSVMGSLKIVKTLNADAPADAKTKVYKFTVTGPNGYSKEVEITGAGETELTGLKLGDYTVREILSSAEISGYSLTVDGDNGKAITLSDATQKTATIENNYTKDTVLG
ncbi:MAG: hypothetical protein J6Y08_04520, partial [Clostridiales bacterium]|nr:hypothetical protein [Clostridiales bacterium]